MNQPQVHFDDSQKESKNRESSQRNEVSDMLPEIFPLLKYERRNSSKSDEQKHTTD